MWHNFVLCVAALAFLFLLPIFLFPVYSTGSGALVTDIVQVSAAVFKLYFPCFRPLLSRLSQSLMARNNSYESLVVENSTFTQFHLVLYLPCTASHTTNKINNSITFEIIGIL